MSIDFVELRLYNDASGTAFELLPNYSDLQFDVKYNDIGALEFSYPLEEAKAHSLGDQSLVGAVVGLSTGGAPEVERFIIEGTDDEKVIDGVRMRKMSGRATLGPYMEDALVYPANWKVQKVTHRARNGNIATLTLPSGHGFAKSQKVFISGVATAFDGEVTLTAATATTISYANTGGHVVAIASGGSVSAIAPTGHEFISQTVGTIMRTLILRAKGRGCFPFLNETSFSGTQDSEAAVWNATHTQTYATGTSYFQILREFMDRAYIDVWLESNNLHIVNGGARGNHIDIGTVELRPAHNVSEMTTTTKSDESATTVLIEGEEGTAVERHDANFQTSLGRRRERYVQQGGIVDAGVLTLLGDAELGLYGRIPSEETVGVSNIGLTPFADFQIADWVWVRYDTDAEPVERRVRQIAVSVDAAGTITLGLTLNTILYESDIAMQRKMEQYIGGGTGSGYGSQPNTSVDNTVPNPPIGLAINSGVYISSQGEYQGAFTAQWTAPTTNVDGSPISDLSHFEIQYRYIDTPVSGWSFLMRTSQQETTFGYSPLTPGRQIEVRVRAADTGKYVSEWVSSTHILAVDDEAPPIPMRPEVTDAIQSVRVAWSGWGAGSVQMPYDLAGVEVWQSATSGTTPGEGDSQRVFLFPPGGGETSIPGFADDQTVYVRLVAVDKAGNASAPSVEDAAIRHSPAVPLPSDDNPPATSPAPIVIGGIGAILVRWDAVENADPVTYEVHVSTAGTFTPDSSTFLAETPATALTLRTLADGTPLAYETTYYVRLVAKDADGSAAPSGTASGTMVQITTPDIAADYAYVGTLAYAQLIGGPIDAEGVLASTIRTAVSGARVEMDNSGLTVFNSAGAPVTELKGDGSTFRGSVVATDLSASGAVRLTSPDNEMTPGSSMTLAQGIGNPLGAPSWSQGYDSTTIAEGHPCVGFAAVDANTWVVARWSPSVSGSGSLELIPKAGGPSSVFVSGQSQVNGVFVAGARIYYLKAFEWGLDGKTYVQGFAFDSTGASYPLEKFAVDMATVPGAPTLAEVTDAAFGYDPHNQRVLMVWRDASAGGALKISRWDITGGNRTTLTTSWATAADHWGVAYHHTEFGVPAYVVHRSSYARVFNASTGAEITTAAWPVEGVPQGMTHDGNNFYGLYGTRIVKYEPDAGTAAWWLGYEWYDSIAPVHRTRMSPARKIAPKRRAKVTIAAGEIPGTRGPDEPNQARFYVARSNGTSQPADTAFWLQGVSDSLNRTFEVLSVPVTSGSNPVASNGFLSAAGASPGEIQSGEIRLDQTPKISLSGNGAANVDGLLPPGSMTMWGGKSGVAPPGWLLCNGQALNTALYPDLFEAIGYSFHPTNPGYDTGSTFYLPNMTRNFPMGTGANPLGQTGGSSSAELTSANQLPPHNHSINHDHANASAAGNGGHSHTLGLANDTSNGNLPARGGGGVALWRTDGVNTVGDHGHTVNIPAFSGSSGSTGSSAPFNVRNPFVAVHFIIKT